MHALNGGSGLTLSGECKSHQELTAQTVTGKRAGWQVDEALCWVRRPAFLWALPLTCWAALPNRSLPVSGPWGSPCEVRTLALPALLL